VAIPEKDIEAARAADPRSFLKACGYDVWKEGVDTWIAGRGFGREYRLNYIEGQEIWLYCEISGYPGGDVIQLAMEILKTGFRDAVFALEPHSIGFIGRNCCDLRLISHKSNGNGRDVLLPISVQGDLDIAIRYLRSRGIPAEITMYAIRQGFLHPVSDGVIFVGRDDGGKPRSLTWRAARAGSEPSKKDLLGSEKRFVPILLGNSPDVWIVEGGADALATHALARLDGKDPPSAIVSGGANASRFLMPEFCTGAVRRLLTNSKRIVVAMEIEKNPEVQARTDKGHLRQADLAGIMAKTSVVELWRPSPEQGKDVADALAFRMGLR
jgi:hypothetical protein